MYTKYQGSKFIDSYFKDRFKSWNTLQQIKENKNKNNLFLYSKSSIVLKGILDEHIFDESLKEITAWTKNIKLGGTILDDTCINIASLTTFNISNKVNSEQLLQSLIESQLNKGDEFLIKFWLDLLVQRFEVTKKIYENYPVNFRKGKGKNDIIHLYCLFSLSLTLFYCNTKSIKYLSTLLKVTDLLCSLGKDLLNRKILPQILSLILLVELLNVKLLSNTIDGVNFESS